MATALGTITVLDFAQGMGASLGASYLGACGARVMKIETLAGDPGRRPEALKAAGMPPAEWNYLFEYANRNKKGVALDFGRGRGIIEQLVEKADVFITDLPKEDVAKWRLDYATLRCLRPDLIYASCSGFGSRGPDRERPAIDELALSRMGLMLTFGEPDYPPMYTGLGETGMAIQLAYGITLALFHRERTGQGQEVHASLFGAHIILADIILQGYLGLFPGETPAPNFFAPIGRRGAGNPLATCYQTKDKWIMLALLQSDRYWSAFCQALGREDLEHDPRFDTHEKRCGPQRREFMSLLEEVFLTRTAGEWEESFCEKGLIYQVINDFQDLVTDPQAWENQFLIGIDHPAYGKVPMVGFPLQLVRTPMRLSRLVPSLGEHTVEVLVDLLGYTLDEVAELKRERVVL